MSEKEVSKSDIGFLQLFDSLNLKRKTAIASFLLEADSKGKPDIKTLAELAKSFGLPIDINDILTMDHMKNLCNYLDKRSAEERLDHSLSLVNSGAITVNEWRYIWGLPLS